MNGVNILNVNLWFSIGSTYTYLTIMRLEEIEKSHDIKFNLKPFSVREVMLSMDNIPFPPNKKTKLDYMWRDIERRAQFYGFPAKVPAPYPLKEFDRANKIAILGMNEGWIKEYVNRTYKEWFQNGLAAGGDQNLTITFKDLLLDKEKVLQRIENPEILELYNAQTKNAMSKGIFGSPTFEVNGELFWGDDRLEDALRWLWSDQAS